MAIPAGDVRRIEAGHGLRFDDEILQRLVERMAEMDVAVRVRRAVVQDVFRTCLRAPCESARRADISPIVRAVLGSACGEIRLHREVRARQVDGLLQIESFESMGYLYYCRCAERTYVQACTSRAVQGSPTQPRTENTHNLTVADLDDMDSCEGFHENYCHCRSSDSVRASNSDGPVAPSAAEMQLEKALQQIEWLKIRLAAQDARLERLEVDRRDARPTSFGAKPVILPAVFTSETPLVNTASGRAVPAETPVAIEPPAVVSTVQPGPSMGEEVHDHMVQLPGGGPPLKIRGFFDFNFGLGTNANPLIYPLPAQGRSTFQVGEFDLFFSSKLARNLNFVGELVFGSDITNEWGVDVERLQLTYKVNKYLEISGGRYHTSIGYYNTAFHHGNWFQTAGGRPFMYYFEDAGGLLPGARCRNYHDRQGARYGFAGPALGGGSHQRPFCRPRRAGYPEFRLRQASKGYNFAAYIRPSRAPGLQIGGSYYRDQMYPAASAITRVDQTITSAYVVYNNSTWEFLGEGVMLRNSIHGTGRSYNSPLSYGQISRKFGAYRPYVRYQYVHSLEGDPVNHFTGRYAGPSIGVRKDISDYAALKLQYNLLQQRLVPNANGLLVQVAFTF